MLLLKVLPDHEFYIDIERAVSIDFKRPLIKFKMDNETTYDYAASEQMFEKIRNWVIYHRIKGE